MADPLEYWANGGQDDAHLDPAALLDTGVAPGDAGHNPMKTLPALLLAVLPLLGQSLEFEVASIKPVANDVPMRYTGGAATGRASWTRVTVRSLISSGYPAYAAHRERISGASALDHEYALEVRCSAGTTDADFRQMIATLLATRFGLRFHEVTKEVKAFAIVAAPSGPRLTASQPQPDAPQAPTTGGPMIGGRDSAGFPVLLPGSTYQVAFGEDEAKMTFRGASMGFLANRLGDLFRDDLLVDQTGLPGKFDFHLAVPASRPTLPPGFVPGGGGPTPIRSPGMDAKAVSSALEKQLGLRLVPVKETIQLMVVDHLASEPTGN